MSEFVLNIGLCVDRPQEQGKLAYFLRTADCLTLLMPEIQTYKRNCKHMSLESDPADSIMQTLKSIYCLLKCETV